MDDRPPGNLLDFEATRFTNLHNNLRFLTERSREVVGRHYQLQYPYVHEFKTARKIRTSSLFSELEASGAVFGQKMGWERPLYFDRLRKEYPVRREFSETVIRLPGGNDQLTRLLKSLGFVVEAAV